MALLRAQGADSENEWTREIVTGAMIRLGRSPKRGWAVAWDSHISREHADIEWNGSHLKVTQLKTARNPIRFDGHAAREAQVRVGESFTIGKTTFFLEADEDDDLLPVYEQEFTSDAIRKVKFRNSDHKLDILTKVPRVLSESVGSNRKLASSLVGVLLEGVPAAEYVAVLRTGTEAESSASIMGSFSVSTFKSTLIDEAEAHGDAPQIRIVSWEGRDLRKRIRPSRRLCQLVRERGQSQIHVWSQDGMQDAKFTNSADLDWAFCVPVRESDSRGWLIYVCGTFGKPAGPDAICTPQDLAGELKFAELIAEFAAEIRQARRMERQHTQLAKFFSPSIMSTLESAIDGPIGSLAPRESEITVLFCDLRGFSRKSEKSQQDLLALLERVNDALLVMTNGILKHDGAIADFQGDAALGFWGWPADQPNAPVLACQAALSILHEFQQAEQGDSLAEFQVGIGIAHGLAIAGAIGTDLQSKIGVFGPVVNLGARLEGLTKQLGASILMDHATAELARDHLALSEGRFIQREQVQPAGMDQPVRVTELVPDEASVPAVSDPRIIDFEAAIKLLQDGQWQDCHNRLAQLPAEFRGREFLMQHIEDNGFLPPQDWNGVIEMHRK